MKFCFFRRSFSSQNLLFWYLIKNKLLRKWHKNRVKNRLEWPFRTDLLIIFGICCWVWILYKVSKRFGVHFLADGSKVEKLLKLIKNSEFWTPPAPSLKAPWIFLNKQNFKLDYVLTPQGYNRSDPSKLI